MFVSKSGFKAPLPTIAGKLAPPRAFVQKPIGSILYPKHTPCHDVGNLGELHTKVTKNAFTQLLRPSFLPNVFRSAKKKPSYMHMQPGSLY